MKQFLLIVFLILVPSIAFAGSDSEAKAVAAAGAGAELNFSHQEAASSAAFAFASVCASGVSLQAIQGGGSIASGNPVCDHLFVAEFHRQIGDEEGFRRSLRLAERAAYWRNFPFLKLFATIGFF